MVLCATRMLVFLAFMKLPLDAIHKSEAGHVDVKYSSLTLIFIFSSFQVKWAKSQTTHRQREVRLYVSICLYVSPKKGLILFFELCGPDKMYIKSDCVLAACLPVLLNG